MVAIENRYGMTLFVADHTVEHDGEPRLRDHLVCATDKETAILVTSALLG